MRMARSSRWTITPRPRPLPDSLGDSFSTRAALSAGASERRLRARDLDAPFRGVRTRRAEASPDAGDEHPVAVEAAQLMSALEVRARAFATVAPPQSFSFGVTAAGLTGLPLPLRVLSHEDDSSGPGMRLRDLDVAVFAPHRALRSAGVRGRQLDPELARVVERRGLRLTDPATTWVYLAPELTVDELIVVGDAIVHEPRTRGMVRGPAGSGLATIEDLAAALALGRRQGAAKLRAALPQIRVGAASPPETRLRLACARGGLPEPSLDYDVFDSGGRPIGFTELAFVEHRVLVEYEGDHHRRDRRQWNRDIEKHAACVAAGWEVVRLTSDHTRPDCGPAVRRIRDALVRAGWRP